MSGFALYSKNGKLYIFNVDFEYPGSKYVGFDKSVEGYEVKKLNDVQREWLKTHDTKQDVKTKNIIFVGEYFLTRVPIGEIPKGTYYTQMPGGGGVFKVTRQMNDVRELFKNLTSLTAIEKYGKFNESYLRNIIKETVSQIINEASDKEYLNWKRKNVTVRGIKELGSDNGVYGSFGKGLYTAHLGNKAMARQYGELRYVVNAIPKNPKIVDSLNNAQIWRQNLVNNFCKKYGEKYNNDFFEKNTTMEGEMMKLGYDGLIIKGREMVNYTPKNVLYFKTERQLENYYENIIKGEN